MDDVTFDAWTKVLGAAGSRRTTLGGLAAGRQASGAGQDRMTWTIDASID